MQRLFEKDCGDSNALLLFSKQARDAFTSSSSKVPVSSLSGSELANEYLRSAVTQKPASFCVASLLQDINSSNSKLRETDAFATSGHLWTNEFLDSNAVASGGASSLSSTVYSNAWVESSLPNAFQQIELEEAWNEAVDSRSQLPKIASAVKWSTEYLDEAERQLLDVEEPELSNDMVTKTSEALANGDADEFWKKLESEWQSASSIEQPREYDWLDEYESVIGHQKEYQFSDDNPFSDIPDSIEQGKKLLADGDLSNAILMFENGLKQQPTNPEAWQLLGTAQAENEQEQAAIAALQKCLELDPSNVRALITLATSFTNEALYRDAANTLKRWLQANSRYSYLNIQPSNDERQWLSSYLDPHAFKEIEDLLMLAVKRELPYIDADVQNALGILYNISGDYDKAVDCFEAALSAKPQDARLWNRLGATLANSNRSQEAVAAYATALQHYPGFVRARYNLGISCMNLRAYREAIEHLIGALALQQRGLGPTTTSGTAPVNVVSFNIWNTLRTALSQINKPELFALVDNHDLRSLANEFNVKLESS